MVAVNYDWDEIEDNVDEENDDTGTTVADYTHEPYLYGDLISQNRSAGSRFYCFDGQGSALAITDSQGIVTDTFGYSAFGEVTQRTGTTEMPFQYVGQKGYYRGQHSTMTFARRRSMSMRLGRWLSLDPLWDLVTRNRYLYVRNCSPTLTDPSGLIHNPIVITLFCDLQFEVDCEVPDPPRPGEPVRACEKHEILPTRSAECQAVLEQALGDIKIRELLDELANLGCGRPTIECAECTGNCKQAGAWHFGGGMGMAGAIFMCDHHVWTKEAMIAKVRHEVTHELQSCRAEPDVTCRDRLKKELLAYRAEGDCDFTRAFDSAVWSACYTVRCSPLEISDTLAIELYEWFIGCE